MPLEDIAGVVHGMHDGALAGTVGAEHERDGPQGKFDPLADPFEVFDRDAGDHSIPQLWRSLPGGVMQVPTSPFRGTIAVSSLAVFPKCG